MKRSSKFTKYILGSLAILTVLVWSAVFSKPDEFLHVYFLDVGQGDAIYVRTMNNIDLLIDGGPGDVVLSELGEVMPFYDHKLDYVLLTHPHSDHISGLIEVLKRYEVGQIIATDATHSSAEYLEWLKVIEEKHIPYQLARQGDVNKLADNLDLKIIWPQTSYLDTKIDNQNNTSIVSQLTYQNIDFLLTGDAELETLESISQSNYTNWLPSEILKVSHHGSENGTDYNFINLVRPETAIISAGENNKFGHPHQTTLDKLYDYGCEIFRTDEDGRIEIISDGQSYWFEG